MKLVKTMPRYKCDFCKRRSVKSAMIIHEKRCFRNPNRYCDYCDNKGEIVEYYDGVGESRVPCIYCNSFDKTKLKDIEDWEKINISKSK